MTQFALGINVRPHTDPRTKLMHGGYLLVITRDDAAYRGVQGQWDQIYRRVSNIEYAPRSAEWQHTDDLICSCGNLYAQGAIPICDWVVTISLSSESDPSDV